MKKFFHGLYVSHKLRQLCNKSSALLAHRLDREPNTPRYPDSPNEEMMVFERALQKELPPGVAVVGSVLHCYGAAGIHIADSYGNNWVMEAIAPC